MSDNSDKTTEIITAIRQQLPGGWKVEKVGTGGGCTAWQVDHNEHWPIHFLLTDADGDASADLADGVLLSAWQNEDGSPAVAIEGVGEDGIIRDFATDTSPLDTAIWVTEEMFDVLFATRRSAELEGLPPVPTNEAEAREAIHALVRTIGRGFHPRHRGNGHVRQRRRRPRRPVDR